MSRHTVLCVRFLFAQLRPSGSILIISSIFSMPSQSFLRLIILRYVIVEQFMAVTQEPRQVLLMTVM